MSLYSLLKFVHILSAMVFLGTGFGTAYFKYRADRCDDLRVIAWMQRETVRADYILTIPAGVLLPLSGGLIVHVVKFGWSSSWVLFGMAGYALAGICWVPAAWLQLRMRALANEAIANQRPLAPEFFRCARYWTILGFPSFLAAMLTVWVMIAKYAAWTLPR